MIALLGKRRQRDHPFARNLAWGAIMPLYSIDLKIAATAYIKAATKEEARATALALKDELLELPNGDWGVEISGRQFDDPMLPPVSLSPAMTILGPFDIDTIGLA